MDKNKSGIAGLASFLALMIAAILFVVEYAVGATGSTWAHYLAIARDIAIAVGILFGSFNYIRTKGLLIKLLFFAAIAVYIVFAFLVPLA